jgi:hypothetical protein
MSNINEVAPEGTKIVDQLFATAHKTATTFSGFEKERVEAIVKSVAQAAQDKAEFYAEWAVRETGFGNVADKHQKNLLNSIGLIDVSDYVDPKVDFEKKLLVFPSQPVLSLLWCLVPIQLLVSITRPLSVL